MTEDWEALKNDKNEENRELAKAKLTNKTNEKRKEN